MRKSTYVATGWCVYGNCFWTKAWTRLHENLKKFERIDPSKDFKAYENQFEKGKRSKYFQIVNNFLEYIDSVIYNLEDDSRNTANYIEFDQLAEIIKADMKNWSFAEKVVALAVLGVSEFEYFYSYKWAENGYTAIEIISDYYLNYTIPEIIDYVIPEVKKMLRKKQPFYITGYDNEGDGVLMNTYCKKARIK